MSVQVETRVIVVGRRSNFRDGSSHTWRTDKAIGTNNGKSFGLRRDVVVWASARSEAWREREPEAWHCFVEL
jgi:hypothetical protein